MTRYFKLRTLPSENMTIMNDFFENYEEDVIRIPKNIMDSYYLRDNEKIIIRKNDKTLNLFVKRAFEDDGKTCFTSVNTFRDLFPTKFNKITLGCDPELFMVDDAKQQVVNAFNFLNKNGDVGHDGMVAELRPEPSTDPNVVTLNLFKLLKKLRTLINKDILPKFKDKKQLSLIAEPEFNQLLAGFHVHLGIPIELLSKRHLSNIQKLFKDIAYIFDYYVGIAALLIDGLNDKRRLSKHSVYGKPGDIRLEKTLEYRVPSAAVLKHPIFTKGILALSSLVLNDILIKLRTTTNDLTGLNKDEFNLLDMYNLPNKKELYGIIYELPAEYSKQYLDRIWTDIKQMPLFEENRYNLTMLFYALNLNTFFTNNIEENWYNYYHDEEYTDFNVQGFKVEGL